jgi:hypothetical protein
VYKLREILLQKIPTPPEAEVRQHLPAGAIPPEKAAVFPSAAETKSFQDRVNLQITLGPDGLPTAWMCKTLLSYESTNFGPGLRSEDWDDSRVGNFLQFIGLYRLAKAVCRLKLGASAFNGSTNIPATFDISSQPTETGVKLLAELTRFIDGLIEYGPEVVSLPSLADLPTDREKMVAAGQVPGPPSIINIGDNIDTDYYQYMSYYSITPLLNNAFVCHLMRLAGEHLKPWQEVLGIKWKRIIPRDNHHLYDAKHRKSVLLSSRLITELENVWAGLHRALRNIHDAHPSVSFWSPAPDPRPRPGDDPSHHVDAEIFADDMADAAIPGAPPVPAAVPAPAPDRVESSFIPETTIFWGDALTDVRIFCA